MQQMYVYSDGPALSLDALAKHLQSQGEWVVRYHPPSETWVVPPTPIFDKLGARAGFAAGRPWVRSAELTVEDPIADVAVYISPGGATTDGKSSIIICYNICRTRLSLLKRVLLLMVDEDAAWVAAGGGVAGHRERPGRAFVAKVRSTLSWYWGWDPDRKPDFPFEL